MWKKSHSELNMSSWAAIKPALGLTLDGLLYQSLTIKRSFSGSLIQIADHDTNISNSDGMGNFQELVKLLLGL